MRVRAVICDVYQTILAVGPPPADAEARWAELWHRVGQRTPPLDQATLRMACAAIVQREHAAARARGIAFPEVVWPAVVSEALPEMAEWGGAAREEFIFGLAGLSHAVSLAPGAAETLRWLVTRGVTLGIASNAQSYTLRELAACLAPAGLSLEIFEPTLRFWSFEHGFSKPEPHAFRLLTARLLARGIAPAEVLMVGDRLDNDIAPARAQGWQIWQLSRVPGIAEGGDWPALAARLATTDFFRSS
ncbi:MAG: HAD family hydrolase [Opitutae bacterium]|nr:HAD family hydrolase [Opitutae bacterium]